MAKRQTHEIVGGVPCVRIGGELVPLAPLVCAQHYGAADLDLYEPEHLDGDVLNCEPANLRWKARPRDARWWRAFTSWTARIKNTRR